MEYIISISVFEPRVIMLTRCQVIISIPSIILGTEKSILLQNNRICTEE